MTSGPSKKVTINLQNCLLIKNGKIVNSDSIQELDIYVEDGVIKLLGSNITTSPSTRVIDARGRYIIPGGIDPHTHLDFELANGAASVDDFYQGTKAAVIGGTTTIIDFVLPKKGESLLKAYNAWRRKADDNVCCDYGLHVCVTHLSPTVLDEMEQLCLHYGINSFKVFMSYTYMLDETELYTVFQRCAQLGALAQVHAEDGEILMASIEQLRAQGVNETDIIIQSRTESVEAGGVIKALALAKRVSCPLYMVHITGREAAEAIREAKAAGQRVYGETLAAAIGTDGAYAQNPSFLQSVGQVCSPPLRPDPTNDMSLVHYLADDVLEVIGSDNCMLTTDSRSSGNITTSSVLGINGVEDRMSIVWERCVHTGIIDPTRYVAITSTNAAKLFNIYPRKGCIAIDSDADLLIWDPDSTRVISSRTHHHNVDLNIFEGMKCHGVPEYVIVGGCVCVDRGSFRVASGHGRFLDMPVHSPHVYDGVSSQVQVQVPGVTSYDAVKSG